MSVEDRETLDTLAVGDLVRFSSWGWAVRSWMVGERATVVSFTRAGLVRVRFTDPRVAYQYGRDEVGVHADTITRTDRIEARR